MRVQRLYGLFCLAMMLPGCAGSADIIEDPPTDTGTEPTTFYGVSEITVTEMSFNQGIGAEVWRDGVSVPASSREVPLIAGRDGVIRLMWSAPASFESREVEARVTLVSGQEQEEFSGRGWVTAGVANRDFLDQTLNVSVPGTAIRGDTVVTVDLFEVEGREGVEASSVVSSVPLEAWEEPMALKVTLFSCAMECGVPTLSTSDAQRRGTEHMLMNVFPVNALALDWRAETLVLDGCSSVEALEGLQEKRANEGASADTYYHCIFPQAYDSFMSGGFGWVLSDELAEPRVSLSVNWWGPGEEMLTNVAHELGHNHGRLHPWNDDNWSPTSAKSTGCRTSWGLGIRSGPYPTEYWYPELSDPTALVMPPAPDPGACEYVENSSSPPPTGDVMSYTFPQWVDPYTYRAFAERIRVLNTFADSEQDTAWKSGRTLFAAFSPEGVRWTWGMGRLGAEDQPTAGQRATLRLANGRILTVPVRPRVDGEGLIRGFSVPLPPSARAAGLTEQGQWAGELKVQFRGREVQLDVATLRIGDETR